MKINTICLIDDDDIYRLTTHRIIKLSNATESILEFSGGEAACDYLKSNTTNTAALPDIIFLDLNMPCMNGWEFLEEYSQLKHTLTKNILIYIVTSSISEIDINRVKEIPEVSGYISKPVTTDRFAQFINTLSQTG